MEADDGRTKAGVDGDQYRADGNASKLGQLTEEQKLDWLELNMEKISSPWSLEAIVRSRQRGIPEREITESFLMI